MFVRKVTNRERKVFPHWRKSWKRATTCSLLRRSQRMDAHNSACCRFCISIELDVSGNGSEFSGIKILLRKTFAFCFELSALRRTDHVAIVAEFALLSRCRWMEAEERGPRRKDRKGHRIPRLRQSPKRRRQQQHRLQALTPDSVRRGARKVPRTQPSNRSVGYSHAWPVRIRTLWADKGRTNKPELFRGKIFTEPFIRLYFCISFPSLSPLL